MKKQFCILFTCLVILFSCNTEKKIPDTDIGVATEFINDIHKGDFKTANQLLLNEDANKQYLDRYQDYFKGWPKERLEYFKNSDILIINEVTPVTDSVTIVNYSTNYKKEEKNKVKVVRVNGQWLVDFKYTFSGNL